ncbi:sensor histidine kinase [Aquimarina litoralis]|uniref:sensor histidine kinase n=1 Tax=Aquimarina litoralis TaxID=584605 RepID=UPI001C55EBB5|nr:HAMP domain-containing sensor histidine kinase [Aquimarina litoralis]MBW1297509.1 GHKL domain-containing protein [Aquimarina litoralis]
MSVSPPKTKNLFKFDKVLFTTVFIVMPGVILDALAEYYNGGVSLYFYRGVVNLVIVSIALILYIASYIKKCTLLGTSVYSVVILMMSTMIWAVNDPLFEIESFFLKVEVIVSLLLFAVGMLVHFRHIISLLVLNFLFIGFCAFKYPELPLVQLAFYAVIVSGGGLMAFFCQRILVKLSREVKEANRVISIKNEKLREMNQSKDDLFRIIGHDLRTPFYQLEGLIDMVDQTDNELEKTKIKAMIKESANKGNQLLEDLLEWGHMYKEQSQVLLENKEVATIVDKVFKFSDMKRKRKQISLINKLPEDLKITINPAMMETVMRNLIANAIKFSHRGSYIIVKSEKMEGKIRIAIEDKGVGMDTDSLFRLFRTEKNSSTMGTENEKGTGFGLSIAKKLVEKQNGVLEIESEYNKGTTINLYFPHTMSA